MSFSDCPFDLTGQSCPPTFESGILETGRGVSFSPRERLIVTSRLRYYIACCLMIPYQLVFGFGNQSFRPLMSHTYWSIKDQTINGFSKCRRINEGDHHESRSYQREAWCYPLKCFKRLELICRQRRCHDAMRHDPTRKEERNIPRDERLDFSLNLELGTRPL